ALGRHRDLGADPASPGARRGGRLSGPDEWGGARWRRGQRPGEEPRGLRHGVAGDPGSRQAPHLLARRAALGAARVHAGRGPSALREGADRRRARAALSVAGQAMRGEGTAMTAVDVAVVGAGPAGAATAILFAERGRRVVLLDKARFPRPKICGEYLSPEA